MDFIKGFTHMKGFPDFIGQRALLTREGDVFLCSGWDIFTLIALDGIAKTTHSEAQMFAHTVCSCRERLCLGHAVMTHIVLVDL